MRIRCITIPKYNFTLDFVLIWKSYRTISLFFAIIRRRLQAFHVTVLQYIVTGKE